MFVNPSHISHLSASRGMNANLMLISQILSMIAFIASNVERYVAGFQPLSAQWPNLRHAADFALLLSLEI
jgi:hypothetical protein